MASANAELHRLKQERRQLDDRIKAVEIRSKLNDIETVTRNAKATIDSETILQLDIEEQLRRTRQGLGLAAAALEDLLWLARYITKGDDDE